MKNSISFRFIILVSVCVLFAGCGKKVDDGSADLGSSSNSTTGGGGPVQADFFSVTVKKQSDSDSIVYAHQFGNLTAGCQIPKMASGVLNTKATDLECMIDIREQDLYFNGMELNVNVPAGLCYYLEEIPYSYYNYEVGTGPAAGTANLTQASAVAPILLASCAFTNQLGASAPGVLSGGGTRCDAADGSGYFLNDGTIHCTYNYTSQTPPRPNCCSGQYSFTTSTLPFGASVPAPNGGGGNWGGTAGNCTEGAWRKNGWPVDSSGFPLKKIFGVNTTGYNENTILPPVISVKAGAEDLYLANMFNWASYAPTTTTQTAWDASVRPVGIVPVTDRSGIAIRDGNESYEYRCVDRAGEIKHRIRVYINKWNTDTQFTNYLAAINTSSAAGVLAANPREGAVSGIEGVNCEVGGTSVNGIGKCDDFFNWDDVLQYKVENALGRPFFYPNVFDP
jgi:hypothetical protein